MDSAGESRAALPAHPGGGASGDRKGGRITTGKCASCLVELAASLGEIPGCDEAIQPGCRPHRHVAEGPHGFRFLPSRSVRNGVRGETGNAGHDYFRVQGRPANGARGAKPADRRAAAF